MSTSLTKIHGYFLLPPPSTVTSIFTDRRPDKDKNEEELRVELGQLRDVWRLDQDELKKLHAVRMGIRIALSDHGVASHASLVE